jgi:hypothetical protein
MSAVKANNPVLVEKLLKKAKQSSVRYKISAIAFDNKGDILGTVTNAYNCSWSNPKKGTGQHAERRLIKRYGKLIKTIMICRVGTSGDILPIDPCPTCQKVANKFGIKIISVMPGVGPTIRN